MWAKMGGQTGRGGVEEGPKVLLESARTGLRETHSLLLEGKLLFRPDPTVPTSHVTTGTAGTCQ